MAFEANYFMAQPLWRRSRLDFNVPSSIRPPFPSPLAEPTKKKLQLNLLNDFAGVNNPLNPNHI